jgi:putative transposase
VNHKRVYRLYRQENLAVRRLKRKRLMRTAVPMAQLQRANQEWALDFVMDGQASGRALRVLTIVDGYSRECLAMEVDSCLFQPACYASTGMDHRAARSARNSAL